MNKKELKKELRIVTGERYWRILERLKQLEEDERGFITITKKFIRSFDWHSISFDTEIGNDGCPTGHYLPNKEEFLEKFLSRFKEKIN